MLPLFLDYVRVFICWMKHKPFFSVRACRNAIEFNQIPSISDIVPGGRENMKLDVLLAVPQKYQAGLDLDAVRKCFPYGKVNFQIQVRQVPVASRSLDFFVSHSLTIFASQLCRMEVWSHLMD